MIDDEDLLYPNWKLIKLLNIEGIQYWIYALNPRGYCDTCGGEKDTVYGMGPEEVLAGICTACLDPQIASALREEVINQLRGYWND